MVRETRHLWVGNLPDNIREERIREHFKRYGRVQNVKLLAKGASGVGSGCGDAGGGGAVGTGLCAAVAFMDIKSAAKAHGAEHTLDERPLTTVYYEPAAIPSSAGSSPAGSGYSASSGSVNSTPRYPQDNRLGVSGEERCVRSSGGPPAGAGVFVPSATDRARPRDRLYRNGPSSYTNSIIERGTPQRWYSGYGGSPIAAGSEGAVPASGSGGIPGAPIASGGGAGSGAEGTPLPSGRRGRARSGSSSAASASSSRSASSSSALRSHSSSSSRASSPSGVGTDRRRKHQWSSGGTGSGGRPLAICVRNLPQRSSDSSLKDGLFHEYKKHGKVSSVKVVGVNQDRYAVVRFKKASDAEKALEVSQDKLFFGCKISVGPHQGTDVEDNESRPYETDLDEFHPKATRTLFIGNLEKDVTPALIREKFKSFGKIIEIDIKKQTGSAAGYAFCQYADISSVVNAIRSMDGEHVGGTRVKLGFGKSMATSCVWIDGVTDHSEKQVFAHCTRIGNVIPTPVSDGCGHALVMFEQVSSAQQAVKELRGMSIRGRKLQVDFASRECQEMFLDQSKQVSLGAGAVPVEARAVERFQEISLRGFESATDRYTRYEEFSGGSGSEAAYEGTREGGGQVAGGTPSLQSVVVVSGAGVLPPPPPQTNMRHLQKERVHLLEQLEECASSGDELVSPKKRFKGERSSLGRRPSGEAGGGRHHRDPSPPVGGKRRRGSEASRHRWRSTSPASRPGTPLHDERPETPSPSEPRRAAPPRRPLPMCLPLPRFAAQVLLARTPAPSSPGEPPGPPPPASPPSHPVPRVPSPASSPDSSPSPAEPSLDERIRSLDERYERWSGSGVRIPPAPEPTERSRFRRRFLDLDIAELQPSEVMRSVLAKRSVFDEDLKRLESVCDKREVSIRPGALPSPSGARLSPSPLGSPQAAGRSPFAGSPGLCVPKVAPPLPPPTTPLAPAKGLQYPFPSHPPSGAPPDGAPPQPPAPPPPPPAPAEIPEARASSCGSPSERLGADHAGCANVPRSELDLGDVKLESGITALNSPNSGDEKVKGDNDTLDRRKNDPPDVTRVLMDSESDVFAERILKLKNSCENSNNSDRKCNESDKLDIKISADPRARSGSVQSLERRLSSSAGRVSPSPEPSEDKDSPNDDGESRRSDNKSESERRKRDHRDLGVKTETVDVTVPVTESVEKSNTDRISSLTGNKIIRVQLDNVTIEEQRAERERVEREQTEKLEREKRDKLEKEKLEKEKQDKERIEKEKSDRERAERERIEKDRRERERVDREKIDREKRERERLDKERREKDRLEREKLTREKHEKEKQERDKQEKEKQEREKQERERHERERQERERQEREKQEKEKQDRDKSEKEKLEKQKVEREKMERERLEKDKFEKEKISEKSERFTECKPEKYDRRKDRTEKEIKKKEDKSLDREMSDINDSTLASKDKRREKEDQSCDRSESSRHRHRDSHRKDTHTEGRKEGISKIHESNKPKEIARKSSRDDSTREITRKDSSDSTASRNSHDSSKSKDQDTFDAKDESRHSFTKSKHIHENHKSRHCEKDYSSKSNSKEDVDIQRSESLKLNCVEKTREKMFIDNDKSHPHIQAAPTEVPPKSKRFSSDIDKQRHYSLDSHSEHRSHDAKRKERLNSSCSLPANVGVKRRISSQDSIESSHEEIKKPKLHSDNKKLAERRDSKDAVKYSDRSKYPKSAKNNISKQLEEKIKDDKKSIRESDERCKAKDSKDKEKDSKDNKLRDNKDKSYKEKERPKEIECVERVSKDQNHKDEELNEKDYKDILKDTDIKDLKDGILREKCCQGRENIKDLDEKSIKEAVIEELGYANVDIDMKIENDSADSQNAKFITEKQKCKKSLKEQDLEIKEEAVTPDSEKERDVSMHKAFLARLGLELRSSEEDEKQRALKKEMKEKKRLHQLQQIQQLQLQHNALQLNALQQQQQQDGKKQKVDDRKKDMKEKRLSIERKSREECTTPKTENIRKKPRKLTNSTDTSDSDEPKKHSIFDIVDEGPTYISMYDKVKARSCKNMQKQEEEKRQEKIKARFSQLKQSRAKREEKKRSNSSDDDSDVDKDRKKFSISKSAGDSSSEDELRRRHRDLTTTDSENDHEKFTLQKIRDICDGESTDDTSGKLMSRKNSRSRIISDTSEDEAIKRNADKLMKIFPESELHCVDMDSKKQLKPFKKQILDIKMEQDEYDTKLFIGKCMSLDDKKPLTDLNHLQTEIQIKVENNYIDIKPTLCDISSEGEGIISDSVHKSNSYLEIRRKHKKKQKRQKSFPLDDEAKNDYHEKMQIIDNMRNSKNKAALEKRKHTMKKDKKREKTKTDSCDSLKDDKFQLKKPKKPADRSDQRSDTVNNMTRGEKMQDIFGPFSDESDVGNKDFTSSLDNQNSRDKINSFFVSKPSLSDSDSACNMDLNLEAKDNFKEDLKKRKDKKRKERKLIIKDDENSLDIDAASKAIEASLFADSVPEIRRPPDRVDISSSITKTNDSDVFRFTDGDDSRESSLTAVGHRHSDQNSRELKEKKKKKKKNREDRQSRKEHHHHHHHQQHHHDRNDRNVDGESKRPPEIYRDDTAPTVETEKADQSPKLECKPTLPSPSLPRLIDSPPPNESLTTAQASPVTPPDAMMSPSAKLVAKPSEIRRLSDKFIPGFGTDIDESISENAVKSISDFENTTMERKETVVEKNVTNVVDSDSQKSEEKAEEKPRAIISQEETEDAVAALLGESFGERTGSFEDRYGDPAPSPPPQTTTVSPEIDDNIPDEEAEEMRQAVQSLNAGELEIKPDTPLSENDLQIDTDTDDGDESRGDQPPKSSENRENLSCGRTPVGPFYHPPSPVKVAGCAPVQSDGNNETLSSQLSLPKALPANSKLIIDEKVTIIEDIVIPPKLTDTARSSASPSPTVISKTWTLASRKSKDQPMSPIANSVQPGDDRPVHVAASILHLKPVARPPGIQCRPPVSGGSDKMQTAYHLVGQRPVSLFSTQPPVIKIPDQHVIYQRPPEIVISPRMSGDVRLHSPTSHQLPDVSSKASNVTVLTTGPQTSNSPPGLMSPSGMGVHRSPSHITTVRMQQPPLSPIQTAHLPPTHHNRSMLSPNRLNAVTLSQNSPAHLCRLPVTPVLAPISKPLHVNSSSVQQPKVAVSSGNPVIVNPPKLISTVDARPNRDSIVPASKIIFSTSGTVFSPNQTVVPSGRVVSVSPNCSFPAASVPNKVVINSPTVISQKSGELLPQVNGPEELKRVPVVQQNSIQPPLIRVNTTISSPLSHRLPGALLDDNIALKQIHPVTNVPHQNILRFINPSGTSETVHRKEESLATCTTKSLCNDLSKYAQGSVSTVPLQNASTTNVSIAKVHRPVVDDASLPSHQMSCTGTADINLAAKPVPESSISDDTLVQSQKEIEIPAPGVDVKLPVVECEKPKCETDFEELLKQTACETKIEKPPQSVTSISSNLQNDLSKIGEEVKLDDLKIVEVSSTVKTFDADLPSILDHKENVDTKEDGDYWSSKDINIESVIKKVDALCSPGRTSDDCDVVETEKLESATLNRITKENLPVPPNVLFKPLNEISDQMADKFNAKINAKRGGRARGRKIQDKAIERVQTRQGNRPPRGGSAASPRRGRGKVKVDKKSRSATAPGLNLPGDVYDFHEDSGDEAENSQNKNEPRPRLILTIKSPVVAATGANIPAPVSTLPPPQKEVPPPIKSAPVMSPTHPPIKDDKSEEFLSPPANTRKSKRLLEKDVSRNSVDDVIEDVIKNSSVPGKIVTVIKDPGPVRRSTRQNIIKTVTPDKSASDIRKSARVTPKKNKDRRESETSADSSDEKLTKKDPPEISDPEGKSTLIAEKNTSALLTSGSVLTSSRPIVAIVKPAQRSLGEVVTKVPVNQEEGSSPVEDKLAIGKVIHVTEQDKPLPLTVKQDVPVESGNIPSAASQPPPLKSTPENKSIKESTEELMLDPATGEMVYMRRGADGTLLPVSGVAAGVSLQIIRSAVAETDPKDRSAEPLQRHVTGAESQSRTGPLPNLSQAPDVAEAAATASAEAITVIPARPEGVTLALPLIRSMSPANIPVPPVVLARPVIPEAKAATNVVQLAPHRVVLKGAVGVPHAGVLNVSGTLSPRPQQSPAVNKILPAQGKLITVQPLPQKQIMPQAGGGGGLGPGVLGPSLPRGAQGQHASPPLLKRVTALGPQPVIAGANSSRAGLASVPSVSPQGQIASGDGAYPHFAHQHYQHYYRTHPDARTTPSPYVARSPVGAEVSEAPSPPLELRRPPAARVAPPHPAHSPALSDRSTDSPQVAQGAQIYPMGRPSSRPYAEAAGGDTGAGRYYDAAASTPSNLHLARLQHCVPPSTHSLPHQMSHSHAHPAHPAHPTHPVHQNPHPHPHSHLHHQRLPSITQGHGLQLGVDGGSAGEERGPSRGSAPAQGGTALAQTAPGPPHASHAPPEADSLMMLLRRYPVMWQGLLALKNDAAAVQMHFVHGNPAVASHTLPSNGDGSTPPLRIAQRMRLEPVQLEAVARKMQMENEHCMLLALPCGRDHLDVLQQSTQLNGGFITYLRRKQAAGIVNVAPPGHHQALYTVHIFPSCDFANENLERIAPDLLHRVADIAHLLIVIATV